jgi:predicted transcriptional regulator
MTRDRLKTTVRLSTDGARKLAELCAWRGQSQASVIEFAIHRLHASERRHNPPGEAPGKKSEEGG